jgi:hypothetical protein
VTRPTLFISNWASRRTPGMHGSGRKFSIMASPRRWEHGDGAVRLLCPVYWHEPAMLLEIVELRRRGMCVDGLMPKYRKSLESRWHIAAELGVLSPRALSFTPDGFPVFDGDSLLCACSVAEARAGRCHRSWIAPFLVGAGWAVILDGEAYRP